MTPEITDTEAFAIGTRLMGDTASCEELGRRAYAAVLAEVEGLESRHDFANGMLVAAAICSRHFYDHDAAREILAVAGLTSVQEIREIGGDAYDAWGVRPELHHFRERERERSCAA